MGVTGEPPEARGRRRRDSSRELAAAPRELEGEREAEREARAPDAPPRRLELVISEPPPAPDLRDSAPVVVRPSDPDATRASEPGRTSFAPSELRSIRSLAGWLALTGLTTLAICGVLGAQWSQGRGSVPSAVAAVLTGAVGLWSLLAGWHLGRAVRLDRHAASPQAVHQLVSGFSHLRSILILKAIGLFLVLGLSCFAFSIVASLLALL